VRRETGDGPEPILEETEARCYGHLDTPATLRCTRCDRPICGRCAIPASVGQHCPECVAEARRGQRKTRSAMMLQAPITVAIIAICVAFFAGQLLIPGLQVRLGLIPVAIHDGQWYRLLTPMLLHGGVLHIAFNMYALWIFGPTIEEAVGRAWYLAAFLITGFAASATSYAFSACNIVGVGASGAIFGIVGVLFVYLYRRRKEQFIGAYLNQLLVILGINLLFGLAVPNIDLWAHGGGFVSGALLGMALDRRPAAAGGQLVRLVGALIVVGLALALVAWRTADFTC
jgi:membrane associated rhomboid family serine protease